MTSVGDQGPLSGFYGSIANASAFASVEATPSLMHCKPFARYSDWEKLKEIRQLSLLLSSH